MLKKIKRLIRYKFNKEHFALVKEAYKGYPFDGEYLTMLEEKKLKEMLEYHKNRSIVPLNKGCRDKIIRTLDLACRIVHIVNNEADLYSYVDNEYTCHVNVNMNNISRFVKKDKIDYMKRFPDEVYRLKAIHLYYLIRERYTTFWWD